MNKITNDIEFLNAINNESKITNKLKDFIINILDGNWKEYVTYDINPTIVDDGTGINVTFYTFCNKCKCESRYLLSTIYNGSKTTRRGNTIEIRQCGPISDNNE